MYKKEMEAKIQEIVKPLNKSFDVAHNFEERCLKENVGIFSDTNELIKCKNELLENLEIIQIIVDEILGNA